ncbi:Rieske Fe-S protein [Actinobacteria bacterium IMCC26207]|nr:Rieske Fe-S protein [Actinobacteria bacterium IMCC26207]
MNALFIIAIILVALFAAIALVGASKRRDTGAAVGNLDGETVKKDRTARKAGPVEDLEPAATGKQVERAAVLARTSTEVAPVSTKAPVAWTPPDPEAYGVTRRQFLNRSIFALFGLSISVFGVAIVGFLWPSGSSGFGSKIRVGKVTDLIAEIERNNGFLYKPEGRMWVTQYPEAALSKAKTVYSAPELNGMEAGLVALYQKCPHLGCRVPDCKSSQWFECPCHGSQYNQVGEKKGGPAPRGMDRFAMEVTGGVFIVNTGQVIQGPPIGTNTTGQEAEGPHCVGGAKEH